MTKKVVGLQGMFLACLMVVSLLGQAQAAEGDFGFDSCSGWVNCSTESPNYTGICCRTCGGPERATDWDCRRVGAERERFSGSSARRQQSGEATITGIVTKEGVLQADRGEAYAVAGTKAVEMQHNMGKKIEVKGTVQEAEGTVTIDVDAYELLGQGAEATVETSGSCSNWLNCDSRPPTFTGTCCRQCTDQAGGKLWDCKVFSEGEHFDLAEWSK